MGATAAVLLAGGPPLAAYALAAVAATAVTITRPAQAVLMPALARTPEELTAANVVSGWIESLSVLAAPALAGVLLAAGGAGTVFAVMAGVALVSALSSSRPVARAGVRQAGRCRRSASTLGGSAWSRASPGPRALVWLLGVESLAIGALDVLYVVLAVGVLGTRRLDRRLSERRVRRRRRRGVAVTVALVGRGASHRRCSPASRSGPPRSR